MPDPSSPSLFELSTLGIALAGLALSIRNTWRDHQRDRVALRVIPKVAYPLGLPDSRPRLAFEVINDSVFAVTVDEVGFLFHGTKARGAMTIPLMPNNESWPHRLEPFASITVYSTPEYLVHPSLRRARCAYVSTANQRVFEGTSEALKYVAATGDVPPCPRGVSPGSLPGFLSVTNFAADGHRL